MRASEILHQKMVLKHYRESRIAIFEMIVWKVPVSLDYPSGVKYRAWLSEGGKTLFGFDNHRPKGPHLHVRSTETGYVFRGVKELKIDIVAMIRKEGLCMKNKRVLLVVEPQKGAMDRAFSVIKRPSKKYAGTLIISFPDFETLGKVITGARLELLNTIRIEKPNSIQQLARMVERDFKNVYQDVKLLAEFGLIELLKTGPRRASQPKAKFSELVLAA